MLKPLRLLIGTCIAAAMIVTSVYVIVLSAFSVRTEAESAAHQMGRTADTR
jgi:hypothetical protein